MILYQLRFISLTGHGDASMVFFDKGKAYTEYKRALKMSEEAEVPPETIPVIPFSLVDDYGIHAFFNLVNFTVMFHDSEAGVIVGEACALANEEALAKHGRRKAGFEGGRDAA